MPAVPAPLRAMPRSRASALRDALELLVRAPEDEQLGGTFHQVDDVGGERAARCGLPGLLAPGQAAGEPRHRHRREHQRHEQHETRLGQEPPQRGHRRAAYQHRHGERLDDPQHDVLQRVDVVDDAGHEVAAAESGEPRRRQCLEPRVDAHAEVGQHAQRGVVADQPLAVAQEAA